VAPGPIWTPLIPSTMPAEKAASFGRQAPLARPGQPKELAPAFVLLASDDGSYMTGAVVPVTGGQPMLEGRGEGGLARLASSEPPLEFRTVDRIRLHLFGKVDNS
jgi:hypothetical protein